MTLKDFLLTQADDVDFDVYDDTFADGFHYCAICKQTYKLKLFRDFGDVLDLEVEIGGYDIYHYITVILPNVNEEEQMDICTRLEQMLYILAGDCDEETFAEYVEE